MLQKISPISYKCVLFLFIIFLTYSLCGKDEDSTDEEFIPTKEWKVIKKGQKVPAGLHYRINLSTGKKEAKLHEKSDKDELNSFSIVGEQHGNSITSDKTENFLKKIDKEKSQDGALKKFRTIGDIKKELGDIAISPKSDIEVVQELFKKFEDEKRKKQPNDTVILNILHDLIYLGHQIDNGNEFCKMDGFKKIIYAELNSTNVMVKQEALKLVSTLASNNPKVKIHILETGGVAIFLRILNMDENIETKNSAITALSCTLRTFIYAQNKFIESGGLTIFTDIFKSGNIKLKLKIVTLLYDLIVERQKDSSNFEKHVFINIEEILYNLGWCKNLNSLLYDLIAIDLYDHDSIEKCLLAMACMSKHCRDSYPIGNLLKLREHYLFLIKNNEDNTEDYFEYIGDLLNLLIENNINTESDARDEL